MQPQHSPMHVHCIGPCGIGDGGAAGLGAVACIDIGIGIGIDIDIGIDICIAAPSDSPCAIASCIGHALTPPRFVAKATNQRATGKATIRCKRRRRMILM